jgi:hypothetical protein
VGPWRAFWVGVSSEGCLIGLFANVVVLDVAAASADGGGQHCLWWRKNVKGKDILVLFKRDFFSNYRVLAKKERKKR